MLFSLKQKFLWIMYKLCSQHLQSFKSVQQKLSCLQPLKDLFQIHPPALQIDLNLPGKFPNDPLDLFSRLWWLPWSQGWSGGCAHTPYPWGNLTDRSLGSSGLMSAVTKYACNAGGRIWNKSLSGCRQRVFVVQIWNFADVGYIACT